MFPNRKLSLLTPLLGLSICIPLPAGIVFGGLPTLTFDTPPSLFSFDTSGLSVIALADGFKITGQFVATVIPGSIGGSSGQVEFAVGSRLLGQNNVFTRAHLSATVTTTGSLNVFAVSNGTSIFAGPFLCSTAASQINDAAGLNGFYSAPTDTGGVCQNIIAGVDNLYQALSFHYALPDGGTGSLTIDFGNSSTSEAFDPAAGPGTAVPEPSTLAVSAGALLVAAVRRRLHPLGSVLNRCLR